MKDGQTDARGLRAAEPAELEQTLALALQFDGRKTFRPAGEMTAKVTAAHLVAQLQRSGFVVTKKPPAAMLSAPKS